MGSLTLLHARKRTSLHVMSRDLEETVLNRVSAFRFKYVVYHLKGN